MTDYVKQHGSDISFPTNGNSWVILSNIENRIKEKIEKIGKPLKDWDIKIYRGILTGCNEAFIIDQNKRDELISKDKKSAEIIRPILRGRDIERYKVNFADLYLINAHNGNAHRNIPPIDINNYPAIKGHLDNYWARIKERDDQGITPYNLRSCAYMDEFSKQKIVYREISDNMNACLVNEDFFINNKSYMITGDMLKYLLGVLNSSVFNKIILQSVNITGGKGANFLEEICVPLPLKNERISILVSERLECHNKNMITNIDKTIDLEVFNIYDLNDKEIDYMSRRES